MEKRTITMTQREFEQFIYEEVQKERHILFDMRFEDYFLLPLSTEWRRKGKIYISMSKDAWEKHLEQLSTTMGDLMMARKAIKMMEPVYREYREAYEKEHGFDFDDYMKMINVSYNTEEFERVRDMFEEEFYKQFDDKPER